MMDGISSATRTDPNPDLDPALDPDRNTPPATRVVVLPPPPPPPDLPDVTAFIRNAVRAATGGPTAPVPHPLLAMGVKGVDVEYVTRDIAIQQRLDAFMQSATPTFHTPEGDFKVAIPFRMALTPEYMQRRDPNAQPYIRQEHVVEKHARELGVVARGLGLDDAQIAALASGRGSPESIRRFTQALIDAGRLPPGTSDTPSRIRTMMCNYGVGLDCAGFVQQAFLASREISRRDAGFRPATWEDLQGLGARGFSSVALSDSRAGDLLILKPPAHELVGHTIIIEAVRMARPEEAEALAAQAVAAHCAEWGHPEAATIQRFDLQSSWGSSADPQQGGVQRQIFWRDTVSGRWMHPSPDGWKVEDTPYLEHPIDGIYRPDKEQ